VDNATAERPVNYRFERRHFPGLPASEILGNIPSVSNNLDDGVR